MAPALGAVQEKGNGLATNGPITMRVDCLISPDEGKERMRRHPSILDAFSIFSGSSAAGEVDIEFAQPHRDRAGKPGTDGLSVDPHNRLAKRGGACDEGFAGGERFDHGEGTADDLETAFLRQRR